MGVAKVISFINMKGGVAKTTLTINIGEELANRGKKVLIIDMDPQFNATQSLLLHRTHLADQDKTVGDFSEEAEAEADIVKEITSSEEYGILSQKKLTVLQIFQSSDVDEPHSNPKLTQKITENLYLIPGDLTLAKEISGDTANKVGAVWDHLSEKEILNEFDFILIDCPPTWSILTHSSLFASDFYIIPSKVDFYSSIGIQLLEEQVTKKILNDSVYKLTKRKLKRLGVIFTLVHRGIRAEEIRMTNLKEKFPYIDFFVSYLPHIPSIPTKFVMYSDAKGDSKYDQVINSIEKITTELLEKIEEGGNFDEE
ncbi:ParA family protein [Aeribacillus sp. FSL K6-1121]|uniref:ParA family protein n=1 Tax=Aeribacillus sp. FSL K6-1121 TaxID=2954745 RepID=UPI0030FCAFEC